MSFERTLTYSPLCLCKLKFKKRQKLGEKSLSMRSIEFLSKSRVRRYEC